MLRSATQGNRNGGLLNKILSADYPTEEGVGHRRRPDYPWMTCKSKSYIQRGPSREQLQGRWEPKVALTEVELVQVAKRCLMRVVIRLSSED